MNLTEYAIKNKAVSYFILALLLVGGAASYFTIGQLEDPVFTVKKGGIITLYPGASAQEVELEVTDTIEKALQETPYLKHLYSFSRPGVSIIKIDVKEEYWPNWSAQYSSLTSILIMETPGREKEYRCLI